MVVNVEAAIAKQKEWLLDGDPSIVWQVKRDLLNAPYKTARKRVATEGWGKQLLDRQCDDGRWSETRGPKGFRGLYTPKWTSTTYTLLLLRRFGVETKNRKCKNGCDALVNGSQWFDDGSVAPWATERTDVCVCGMFLGILSYFDHSPEKRDGLLEFLIENQRSDGGWNCRDQSDVSSVHSTLSVLEALQILRENGNRDVDDLMADGQEYLLKRNLFRSARTGRVISEKFKMFSFPPRWKYDVMRALDHFQASDADRDERLQEAIDLLVEKRTKDGRWKLQNRHSGETHFEIEKTGKPSRWNTLRALRILKWFET